MTDSGFCMQSDTDGDTETPIGEPTGRTAVVEVEYTVRITEREGHDETELIMEAVELIENMRKDPSDAAVVRYDDQNAATSTDEETSAATETP